MEQKSQNLLKCKTKSNKKAELNNILTPGTTPKTPVNFRIKKKTNTTQQKHMKKEEIGLIILKEENQMIKHCHKV